MNPVSFLPKISWMIKRMSGACLKSYFWVIRLISQPAVLQFAGQCLAGILQIETIPQKVMYDLQRVVYTPQKVMYNLQKNDKKKQTLFELCAVVLIRFSGIFLNKTT